MSSDDFVSTGNRKAVKVNMRVVSQRKRDKKDIDKKLVARGALP
jgi:hypothetical protein